MFDKLKDAENKEKGLAELGEKIEKNLYLLGATGKIKKFQIILNQ